MYRILFSAMLIAGIFNHANAQNNESAINANGIAPLKNASSTIEKLSPKLTEIKLPESGYSYKFSLDIPSTKAVMPEVIRVGTKWTEHGKNGSKATNFETIDYAQLVPLLVAALQEQQAQIADLKRELAGLKKETAAR